MVVFLLVDLHVVDLQHFKLIKSYHKKVIPFDCIFIVIFGMTKLSICIVCQSFVQIKLFQKSS